jgi:hypothetical protein
LDGLLPDGMGRFGTITPTAPVRSRKWLILPALIFTVRSNRLSQWRHQRHKHEVVKEAVMDRRFSLPACLMLLCGLLALGETPSEAAGIGVHLRGPAQNIPRAVAGGHNPHIGGGAGARALSRPNPDTRSIQPGGAGESTATRSLK